MASLRVAAGTRGLPSALARPAWGQASDETAVAHAREVFDLLRQEKFDEVATQFNSQVAAVLDAARLRALWTTLRQQMGPFRSYVDQRVASAPGITTIILGCQFETTMAEVLVVFDSDDKLAGLRVLPRAVAAAPAEPPASSLFTEEAITVGSGEWALPGTLSIPAGAMAAAMVLVHGSGPNDRDETIGANTPFRDLAWGLANRGIAVLRYDKRTRVHGARMLGDTTMTVREETTADALLAVAALRHHDRIDPENIFVLGHSLGGVLGPRIAAEDPSLAGLIILAGSTRPLLESAREQLAYLSSLNPGSIDAESSLQALRRAAPESYWNDLDAYDPVQTAAHLSTPILILQGERDYQVTMADLRGWRDGLGTRKNVTIKSYPTLNHLFMAGEGRSTPAEYERASHIPEFVLDDIASWITTR
jgi:dipeptidyl aminopeptidase/acylaminoacyl peptidase